MGNFGKERLGSRKGDEGVELKVEGGVEEVVDARGYDREFLGEWGGGGEGKGK